MKISYALLITLLIACAPITVAEHNTLASLEHTTQITPCPNDATECLYFPFTTSDPTKRVLLVTATSGFYHTSIVTARDVIQHIADESQRFSIDRVDNIDNLDLINTTHLAHYDVIVFANTSGELPLNDAQKQALLDFVSNGKGFIGTHSATDTLYDWNDYGDLIGAYFDSHPWTQSGTIDIEDESHLLNAGLATSYSLHEEFYTFRANPRPNVHVLQSLNAASVGASGDYPLVWCKTYGAGRVYYNALGHFNTTWNDPRFQQQLHNALLWTSGLLDADCSP